MHWIDIQRVLAPHACGMYGVALLVEYRHPGRVIHCSDEDFAPGFNARVLLVGFHHAVRRGRLRVQRFVAVARPVPAALYRPGAAEDRAIEVGGIREIGDPRHAAGQTIGAWLAEPPAAITFACARDLMLAWMPTLARSCWID